MLPTISIELLTLSNPVQTAFDGALTAELFLLGRLLFGGILAFNGLNHLLDSEAMVGYAGAKGVPAPGLMVPFTGGLLLFGGLGIMAGVVPTLAAGALVAFLLITTPLMHDFWAVPEEQKQGELINFMKNIALAGAALALFAISATAWPYSLL